MADNGWKKFLPFESKKLNVAALVFCAAISAHNAYNYFSPEVTSESIMDAYFAHSSIEKSEFEKMEQYILDRVPAEDFAAIRKNLKPTSVILEESPDKAYHEGAVMEHACPVEIKRSLEPLEKRLPDVVGVGFAKCGTGTLQFLDCHPGITMRSTEPKFYTRQNAAGIIRLDEEGTPEKYDYLKKIYYSRLPLVAKDEILVEKSPQYSGYDAEEVAKAMKTLNPKTKIIGIACDPIKRVYSQFAMKDRRTEYKAEEGLDGEALIKCKACLNTDLNQTIQSFTEQTQRRLLNGGISPGFDEFARALTPFVEQFGDENVLLLDGENLITHPNEEWGRLLEFLGLKKDSMKFYIDEEKGFPCLEKPVKYCLNGAKGTSRKIDVRKEYPDDTAIWRKSFSPQIKEMVLFKKICSKIDNKCCKKLKDEKSSFSWAYEFVCP